MSSPENSIRINAQEKENVFLEQCVKAGVEEALKIVETSFEKAEFERDNMDFHQSAHTRNVAERARLILSTIHLANPESVSGRDVLLGELAGAFHDTVQLYKEDAVPDGVFTKLIRKRFTSFNERASGDLAIAFAAKINEKNDRKIFSTADENKLLEAVDATVPGYDREKETVIQPNLKASSSLVARAVALADLGSAGMAGAENFLKDGNALFREENLDIADALKNPGDINDDKKKYFRKRMLDWSKSQIKFAEGRKSLLDTELVGIPNEAREKVKTLFNKFDDSIEGARKCAEKREGMSLEELVKDMGYKEK